MQQMASDINKMRRSLYVMLLLSTGGAKTGPVTGDQMQKDSKSWLSPPDPSKNYNIGYKTHQDGTATWFFEGNVFDKWNAKGSLLWIHGKRAFSKYALATTQILIPSV